MLRLRLPDVNGDAFFTHLVFAQDSGMVDFSADTYVDLLMDADPGFL